MESKKNFFFFFERSYGIKFKGLVMIPLGSICHFIGNMPSIRILLVNSSAGKSIRCHLRDHNISLKSPLMSYLVQLL